MLEKTIHHWLKREAPRLRAGLLLSFCFWLMWAAQTKPVSAHANLVRSIPEANAVLERSPVQVELLLTEAIEPGFSTIEVLDGNGKRVDNEDAVVDPSDPTRITVSLRSLSDGVYLVSWRALSAIDSHITAGAFPFVVGEADPEALAAALAASTQVRLAPGEMIARWGTFMAMMVLSGGSLFILMVWDPARSEDDPPFPYQKWYKLAVLILLLANVVWILVQSGQVIGAEIAAPWNPTSLQILFATRFGAQWLARVVLAATMLFLLYKSKLGYRQHWILAVSLLMLLTVSLGSHAAAEASAWFPITADLIHLAVSSFWVGGLLFFVIGMRLIRKKEGRSSTTLTAALIPRFTRVAFVSVILLLLTGIYASWLHLDNWANLTGTLYGQTLLVKLGLFVPMLLVGALNMMVTSPRVRQLADSAQPTLLLRFARLISGELVLGGLIILTVGVLTTLPPASIPEIENRMQGESVVDDLEIALEANLGRPGLNTFEVTVLQDGVPATGIKEVELQFSPATVDLPPSRAQLIAQSEGKFEIEGGFVAVPDLWQLQVVVRREGAFDAYANFDFSVGGAGATLQKFPWHLLTGALVLLAGIAYLFMWHVRTTGRRRVLAYLSALILISMGGFVMIKSPIPDTQSSQVNPIAPNEESIATGEAVYRENCLPCHGVTGAGDGPVGLTLNPPPADLIQHALPGVHPDGRLFGWVSNGVVDSVMPAFKDRLTDEERWHVVNYMRTLPYK